MTSEAVSTDQPKVMRVLQRIVFPIRGDLDVVPLYVETNLERGAAEAAAEQLRAARTGAGRAQLIGRGLGRAALEVGLYVERDDIEVAACREDDALKNAQLLGLVRTDLFARHSASSPTSGSSETK